MKSRIIAALLSLALVAAGPVGTPTEIPWAPDSDEALIVPVDSPVRFARYDESRVAHFRGRFVLTGTFVYGCDIECETPLAKEDLYGSLIPDSEIAARLPHWKMHNSDMRIFLTGADRLAAQVVTSKERAALFAGKVDNIRKRVSIVVDDFNATLECDGASYGANFVSLAKPPKLATEELGGDYGCGWI